jgi:hypothetical protein
LKARKSNLKKNEMEMYLVILGRKMSFWRAFEIWM